MNKVIEIIDSDDDSHTPTSTLIKSTNNNMEQDDSHHSNSRRRRRKSALHAMTDPDMQFQTISLEDDEDDVDANNSNPPNLGQKNENKSIAGSQSLPLLKLQKIAPKILAPKAQTNEKIVDTNFERFINDPETINDVYAIAEERARINYLLAMNGIPEINFALYTRPERLQLQFEERLKRKMGNNRESIRQMDNRRSLLQNNEEHKT